MKRFLGVIFVLVLLLALMLSNTNIAFAASIIYVNADASGANDGSAWTDAYTDLQDALDAASSGDEIWVAKSIYRPDQNSADPNSIGDREATFELKDKVTLKGGFAGFGEAYFSSIKNGEIKGWNRHKKMTLNLVVPVGKVTFVLFENKEELDSKNNFFKVELSSNNYQRLTIPPGVWFAFIGGKYETNLILNVANIEHDPDELDRLEINQIDCNWNHI